MRWLQLFPFLASLLAGVSLDGQSLSGFEIFQIAFQHGRSSCIKDLSFEGELVDGVREDLTMYLNRLPLGRRGWTETWKRWSEEQEHFFWIGEVDEYSEFLRLLMDTSEFTDSDMLIKKLQAQSPYSTNPTFQSVMTVLLETILKIWITFSIAIIIILIYDTIYRLSYTRLKLI